MSRLNTLYPNDEFLKNMSNMFGKVDSKNESEIKQEIEQIGYKEFYRYYKEKNIRIDLLQQRINKAIEYIKSEYTITDDDVYLTLYSSNGTLDKLEGILKGED